MDIEDILDEMNTRESQLSERLNRLNELISSQPDATDAAIHNQQIHPLISCLPYEMLTSVFKNGPNDPSSRMAFALSVSQVSRYWRDIAMQTPFLWSGIHLLPWRTGLGYQKFLEILIQRSHSHPLDIAITRYESHSPQYINRRNRMMALLHPLDASTNIQHPETNHCLQAQLDIAVVEVSRWRSFTYHCDHPDGVSELTERLAYLSAPILESFELEASSRGSEIQDYNIFLGGAPMLTHVHIHGVDPFSCLPPLSFVTSLRFERAREKIGGEDLLSILQCSPVLVSLHFEGTVVDLEDLFWQSLLGAHIEIQTLRCFSFSASPSPKYFIDGILNAIRCPALESLTISNLNSWGGVQPSELPSTQALPMPPFPMPPFPMLRYLKLSWIQCAQFAEYFDLTHLPLLDTISLTNCKLPIAVLHLLLPIQGRDDVWPVLRVIALSHLGLKEFDDLGNIILHRRACGRPIVAVEIDPVSLRNFPVQVEWLKQHVTVQRGERVHYRSDLPSYTPLMNVPTQSETAL